jgi:hypothetical protein
MRAFALAKRASMSARRARCASTRAATPSNTDALASSSAVSAVTICAYVSRRDTRAVTIGTASARSIATRARRRGARAGVRSGWRVGAATISLGQRVLFRPRVSEI